VTKFAHPVGRCRLGERIFGDGRSGTHALHDQHRDPVEMRAVAIDLGRSDVTSGRGEAGALAP